MFQVELRVAERKYARLLKCAVRFWDAAFDSATIGRFVDHHRQVRRRQRLHREAADHLNVGVASPYEHELGLRSGSVGCRQSALL